MSTKMIFGCAMTALTFATAHFAFASERNYSWCRQVEESRSPMTWSEGFGVSTCNDRATTPYRPWHSAEPLRRDQSDPMLSSDDQWRVDGFSDYDHRYDDHYDRRPHRYR